MKILILGRKIATPEQITAYSEMWMHYLCDALEKQGAELTFYPRYHHADDARVYTRGVLDAAKGMQAILAPGVRYFTTIPIEIGDTLCREFPGWVTQVHDGSLLDSAPVDMTLTVRDDAWRYRDSAVRMGRHSAHNTHIGWAASDALFYPEPSGDVLRIFIDHAAFDISGFDFSLSVQMNLRQLKVPFIARTLTDDGVITIDPDNITVRPYNRTAVPADVFARELRAADIFIVTHPESLGLTVLEAAKCGALVLAPEGAIARDRINEVEHVIYSSRIQWDEVLVRVDKTACAARVAGCTWSAVAQRILAVLTRRKPA